MRARLRRRLRRAGSATHLRLGHHELGLLGLGLLGRRQRQQLGDAREVGRAGSPASTACRAPRPGGRAGTAARSRGPIWRISSRPCSRVMPVPGSARSSLVEKLPERADDARLDQLELAEQVVLAGVDLARQRVAVAGRPALQDVRDEDVGARQPDLAEQRVEQLARPGRRTAGPACPRWRPGASPTNIRSASALPAPNTTRGARRGQLGALRAGLRLLPDRLQLFAPRLRRGHAATLSAAAAARTGEAAVCGGLHSALNQPVSPMRELDRTRHSTSCAIVGAGRLGTALAAALRATGLAVDGPLGRGASPEGVDAVLLCVPDAEIAAAAAARRARACRSATARAPRGSTCSRATRRSALHPLMTVPADGAPAFAGAGAAVAGSTPRALAIARGAGRAARACAPRRSPTPTAPPTTPRPRSPRTSSSRSRARRSGSPPRPGVERALLAPLVRAAVENWARLGAGRRADRPDRARRRGHGRAPARRRRGAHARPAAAVRRARRRHARRSPGAPA